MKKISLVLTALALTTMSYAQHVQFGLKAGVNLADLKDDALADNAIDKRTGYHFGGLAHIHISRNFAIQPEVVYSAQGAEYKVQAYSGTNKLNYINVPVLAQYMFSNGLRIQTGPQVSFLTSAKFKPDASDTEIDIENSLDNADFAWSFGAGYLLPVGLGLDARYNLGINNVRNNNSTELHNRVWQIGLFYQFPARLKKSAASAQ